MPVYHSGNLSKTDRPDYNYPLRPQTPDLTLPFAPRNLIITSPYNVGVLDIRWDNPRIIPQNSGLNILGCNVYRATDSPIGPYELISTVPVTVLFFRDQTQEDLIVNENATPTLRYSMEPGARWLVFTQRKPVTIPGTNGQQPSTRIQDIKVEIDNGDGIFLEMPAYSLDGITGQVELINFPVFNYTVQQIVPPRLPTPPNGRVRLTYRYLKHSVLTKLNQRIYYKVTTVAVDPKDNSQVIETPLEEVSARSAFDIEALDYIWREAILRNRWILEQGGERVKILIRKWMGPVCPSHQQNYGQAYNDCKSCMGTNIVGGYLPPVDAIIAPPESDKMVELADMGLHIRYDWATWTTDYPLLNTRDVIVRQNNERYVVGPVNPQGSRGVIYQQHFTMSYIDQGDIRYMVPITGAETQVPASYDPYRQTAPTDASPVINAKPEVPQEKIIRGKTVVFENIMYAIPLVLSLVSILCKTLMLNLS
jgi:hypothetical protein